MSNEVPFGKYKGRPVEEMLSDRAYMEWLEAQPWFRERFGHLRTAKDEDAMSRTPVHNRLQALFLDTAYREAFVEATAFAWMVESLGDATRAIRQQTETCQKFSDEAAARADDIARAQETGGCYLPRSSFSTPEKDLKQAQDAMGTWARLNRHFEGASPFVTTSVAFECEGADVMLRASIRRPNLTWNSFPGDGGLRWTTKVGVENIDAPRLDLRIEIKPTVADEYPAVLRQMNRNKSEYLFVDRYQGEGATEAQFVAMFAASGKRVVFKRDVDALL